MQGWKRKANAHIISKRRVGRTKVDVREKRSRTVVRRKFSTQAAHGGRNCKETIDAEKKDSPPAPSLLNYSSSAHLVPFTMLRLLPLYNTGGPFYRSSRSV